MAVRLYEISYDVCEKNLVTIIAGSDRALSTPFVKIRGIESGVYPARLIVPQPFTELNKVSSISKYVYEAPLTSKDEFFIVTAQLLDVRWTAEASYSVNISGCKDTIVITEFEDFDTRISEPTIDPNRPQVFDVKYQIGNDTLQFSPTTPGLFITGDEPITVSGIVHSTTHPTRVELRTITAGGLVSEYAAIVMNIVPLDVENAYRVSAEIPRHFIQAPAITFWIQAINEKHLIQESKKQTIGVKRGGGLDIKIELDSMPNQAQGTLYSPIAYIFSKNQPIFGSVSLLVNNQTVYTSPVQIFDSDNPAVLLEWKIPKSKDSSYVTSTQETIKQTSENSGILESVGKAIITFLDWLSGNFTQDYYTSLAYAVQENNFGINGIEPIESGIVLTYQISARLNVYDEVLATTSTTLNTFPSKISSTISEPVNVYSMKDNLGNDVANAILLYSSYKGDTNFHYRVISPDGICFIGQSDQCIVNESTVALKGNMKSVDIQDQIFRIKYLGPENTLERFTISSIDPIIGKWDITLESSDGTMISKNISDNVQVKTKYKAHEDQIVTTISD